VDYGLFSAAVSTDTTGNLIAGCNSTAGVFGRSDDQITINPQNSALIGTLGTMTFLVEDSGSLTATESSANAAYADALWAITAFTDFGNPAFVSAQVGTAPYFETYGDASGGIYALTLPATSRECPVAHPDLRGTKPGMENCRFHAGFGLSCGVIRQYAPLAWYPVSYG
jgi:hypothetical protein